MTIEYKKMLAEQALLYRAIRLESLQQSPESFGAKFEEQVQLKELRFESLIKQEDGRNFVMGAFVQESVIGISAFSGDNPYDLAETGSIIQVYVKEAFSGQKIGYNLIKAIVTEAFKLKTIKQIILEVNKNNLKAINVYEQAGFKKITSVKASDQKSNLMLIKKPKTKLASS